MSTLPAAVSVIDALPHFRHDQSQLMQPAAHVELVRAHVLGLMRRLWKELDLQGAGDSLGDCVLHLEDVRELLVEFFRPQLPAVRHA